ncbi:MAG TPA: NAD(P)-binding domain-containing protein [Gaiellaceae bacterium]|nr:NAD(P)-binding domain-containing protein [Gaiellaceae bacterium]
MQETEQFDTVIVGGGQAGLAVGYHLTKQGHPYVILDANDRVGDSWRKRWPSLRLYSPAVADALPGMRFPAPPYSFPSGSDMAEYLDAYAKRFALPVRTGVRVDALEKDGDRYLVVAGDRRFQAANVVVATGGFQHDSPVIPAFAGELDPRIRQLHSADYRSPADLQEGAVLVVGAAHSGGDIAYEVARAGHRTLLSGRDTGQLPFDIQSRKARVIFPLLRFAATRVITVKTPIGRKARPEIRAHGGPLLRVKRGDLEAAGVERVVERTVGVENGKPVLADGRVADVANVIWCTGFRRDYTWIRFPLPLDADGYPEQKRGAVPSSPGLYFTGLPFLHSFASMLVLGAGRDGDAVASHILRRAGGRRRARRGRRDVVSAGQEIAA